MVSVFALSGLGELAIALLSVLVATSAIVSRVGFATRRRDIREQRKEVREIKADLRRTRQQLRRGDEAQRRLTTALHEETRRAGASSADRALKSAAEIEELRRSDMEELQRQLLESFRKARIESNAISTMREELTADMLALRAELRGMRVGQQLMSQAVAATKVQTQASIDAAGVAADDVQGIHQLLGRYMPTAPLPSLTSSRLRATGSFLATDLVERMNPDVVRCVGAVAPALWIAYALRHRGQGTMVVDVSTPAQVSEARDLLAAHGLTEWANVRLTHDSAQADTEQGDSDHSGMPSGAVDLLVLDERDFSSHPRLYPRALDLEPLLSQRAVIVVAGSDDSSVQDLLHEWIETHEGLRPMYSPRADIAVLAWGIEADTPTAIVSD